MLLPYKCSYIPVVYIIFQILDRKNTEIDELKTHYRNKGKEHDENCAKLEKKGKWSMEMCLLTHCGLVMPYGDMELVQHWFQ